MSRRGFETLPALLLLLASALLVGLLTLGRLRRARLQVPLELAGHGHSSRTGSAVGGQDGLIYDGGGFVLALQLRVDPVDLVRLEHDAFALHQVLVLHEDAVELASVL